MTNGTFQYRYASWQDAFKMCVFIFFLTTLLTKKIVQENVAPEGSKSVSGYVTSQDFPRYLNPTNIIITQTYKPIAHRLPCNRRRLTGKWAIFEHNDKIKGSEKHHLLFYRCRCRSFRLVQKGFKWLCQTGNLSVFPIRYHTQGLISCDLRRFLSVGFQNFSVKCLKIYLKVHHAHLQECHVGDGVLMQQFKLNCGDCYGFRLKKRIRLQIDLQYTLLFRFRDSYELFYKCINIV